VLALGVAVRLVDFNDPPLDFHPIRQFQGALITRHFYYLLGGASTTLERAANTAMLDWYEPPIKELLGAGIMRLLGHESLAVLRGIALVEYMLAALVLYLLLRRLATPAGRFAGLALFLLLPFGISVSRSFLTDTLMVVFLELTLLAVLRYQERRNLASMALVALAAGVAIFVKLQAAPLLLPLLAWAVLQLRPRLSAMAWGALLVAVSMLPALGWLAATRIPGNVVFVPSLLLTPGFYASWALLVSTILGPGLVVVVLAVSLLGGPSAAPLRLLGAGYILYAVLFDYRVETHSYYSLVLVPLAALSLAVLVSRLDHPARRLLLRLAIVNVALIALLAPLGPWAPLTYIARSSHDATVAKYLEIGRLVGRGSTAVLLADGLGTGGTASYYTGGAFIDWPGQGDLALERLSGHAPVAASARLAADISAGGARWMVVTNPAELKAQADLRTALASYHSTTAGGVTVYDLGGATP
jgi:hypothetical protein